MENKPDPVLYAGIGASAGGLESIESFFSPMPPQSGQAFVAIQLLSPDHKSLMVDLLSKRTPMPVARAETGLKAEPDTIYLITPKENLTLFHGNLLLSDPDPNPHINLPVDIFFKSLATDQNSKAVAGILSGTGGDDMHGVRAIKEHGAMVMVQNPDETRFDGMPGSAISTHLADFILKAADLPQHNFIKDPAFTTIDLISCCNLLIDLQPVSQQKAMELFNFSQNDGELLFLVSIESTEELTDHFEVLSHPREIFRTRDITHGMGLSPEMTKPILSPSIPKSAWANEGSSQRIQDDCILEGYLEEALETSRVAVAVRWELNGVSISSTCKLRDDQMAVVLENMPKPAELPRSD